MSMYWELGSILMVKPLYSLQLMISFERNEGQGPFSQRKRL